MLSNGLNEKVWKTVKLMILLTFFTSLFSVFAGCPSEKSFKKSNSNNDEKLFEKQRKKMVQSQIKARGIKDPAILMAMEKVPRHLFVPSDLIQFAYDDGPLPIGEGQTISQPYIVALMTELIEPKNDSKVLEIGTGSGYQAAILAEIVKEVYSIEIVETLGKRAEERLKKYGYRNIHVKIGDGYQGWTEHAPYDAIIVTAAPERIPQPLVDQLKPGGKLIIPIGQFFQDLILVKKTDQGILKENITGVRFVPMTGEAEKQ